VSAPLFPRTSVVARPLLKREPRCVPRSLPAVLTSALAPVSLCLCVCAALSAEPQLCTIYCACVDGRRLCLCRSLRRPLLCTIYCAGVGVVCVSASSVLLRSLVWSSCAFLLPLHVCCSLYTRCHLCCVKLCLLMVVVCRLHRQGPSTLPLFLHQCICCALYARSHLDFVVAPTPPFSLFGSPSCKPLSSHPSRVSIIALPSNMLGSLMWLRTIMNT
jgi:hypothetical protein